MKCPSNWRTRVTGKVGKVITSVVALAMINSFSHSLTELAKKLLERQANLAVLHFARLLATASNKKRLTKVSLICRTINHSLGKALTI